jgi:hypothetical protein
MRRHFRASFAMLLALTLGGCTWAEWLAINNSKELPQSGAVFTDAKQRAIVATTPGSPEKFFGYITPKKIICAEPSPDVAQAVSASISASIEAAIQKSDVSGQGNASLALAAADSIAQLGERLGTIQLLRDQGYRACEAHANGVIGATTYTLMMSRINRTMTTLLLGEMAAGAFGRRLATISGNASASVLPRVEDLKKALDEIDSAKKAADEANSKKADLEKQLTEAKTADSPPNTSTEASRQKVAVLDAKVTEAKTEATAADQRLASAEGALREKSVSATASGRAAAEAGQISGQAIQTSGKTLVDLQRQFFDMSDLSAVLDACITATDRIDLSGEERKKLTKVFDAIREVRKTGNVSTTTLGELNSIQSGLGNTAQSAITTEEKVKWLRDTAAQIAQMAPMTPFAFACSAKMETLMSEAAKMGNLPIPQVEEEKAKAETERIQICQVLWNEAVKPNANQTTKGLAEKCAADLFKGKEAPAQRPFNRGVQSPAP